MANRKRQSTNNDVQNTTQKTKDPAWTPLKTGDELRYSGRISSSCSTSDTDHATVKGHDNYIGRCTSYSYDHIQSCSL